MLLSFTEARVLLTSN